LTQGRYAGAAANADPFDALKGSDGFAADVERRALRIWRDREMTFPPRIRRMTPDSLDRATGAWDIVLMLALGQSGGKNER